MNNLYLIDATVTETNAVKLKFIDADGKAKEIVDEKFRPYFLAAHPLTSEQGQIVEYFSGIPLPVEKKDLYTGEERLLTKISWPNAQIAKKAAEKLGQTWESEIALAKSYVYDHGLIFGAAHSEGNLEPALDMHATATATFEKNLSELRATDPLKHAQAARWFALFSQPIPKLDVGFFGVREADEERMYTAWMLSRMTNLPLSETFDNRRVSDWLKSTIYTYLRKNGILIPTSQEFARGLPTHKVAGALTVAPKPGIYFNTVVCDFESLYPSCIDSFNLSYETVNCPHSECLTNRIPDFEGHICTKRRGFYAILIGALKELRIKVFKRTSRDNSLPDEERKKAEATEKLLKLILVSSYGVTVRIHGLACPPLAEAITGHGRYMLKESWRLAENLGMRPLYGDTDSLFLDNPSNEQITKLVEDIKERFRLDLAIDKRYGLCVLPKAKKAYFGILLDGTPDIKGVTPAKSNAPAYISNTFQKCVMELANVRNQADFERATKRIKETVRKAIADLRNGKIQMEDLAYSVKLFFDPNEKLQDMKSVHQPYQCAQQLIDAGKKLERWTTVAFVKVKPFKYKGRTFTVKPVELARNLRELNVKDYVRNLLTALNQTFESMGIVLEMEREPTISDWLES